MSVTITSTSADGTHVEITIEQSANPKDEGSITVKKWGKDKDPKKDKPDSEDKNKLKDIKAKKDGSKLVCKGDAPNFSSDPTVTFTINCPEPPKKPSVTVDIKGTTFGAGDKTTTYDLSKEDQDKIKKFIVDSKFPALAMAQTKVGGAIIMLAQGPLLLSKPSLDRLGLTVMEMADSLLSEGDDWVEENSELLFVGMDRGVKGQLILEGGELDPALVLSIRLPRKTLETAGLELKDAFLHPRRFETADEAGVLQRSIPELSVCSIYCSAPAPVVDELVEFSAISRETDEHEDNFEWTFSDGIKTYGQYVSHRFGTSGRHSVSLVIRPLSTLRIRSEIEVMVSDTASRR